MKKVFRLSLVVTTLAFILSACATVAGAFVQLDPALADWIVIGSTVLVGIVIAKALQIPIVQRLLEYFKLTEKVEQYRLVISAWLAGVIIQFVQAGILDKIPAMWDNVVTIVMQLIVSVIVTLYGFRLLADRSVKGFK